MVYGMIQEVLRSSHLKSLNDMSFKRGIDPKQALGIGLFVYDNGFGPRHYLCTKCGSFRLIRNVKGGFQPPDYTCTDCGETVYAPCWENLDEETLEPLSEIKTGGYEFQ
jgi:hypothetical protein